MCTAMNLSDAPTLSFAGEVGVAGAFCYLCIFIDILENTKGAS